MEFIAYIWKPGAKTAMLSKDNETFDEFKARVYSCYPYQMGWVAQFSEFKEIYQVNNKFILIHLSTCLNCLN